MATHIPKNARKILSNPALTRDFFLKPYGLDVKTPQLRFQLIKISQKSILNTNSLNIEFFWGVQE